MEAGGFSAATGQVEFLKLLVTQIQHQDPLEPTKQEEFLGQLAQFSTLEGIEKLNANFEDFLQVQELSRGANLLGQQAVYSVDGEGSTASGRIDAVSSRDNQLFARINGADVPIESIVELVAGTAAPSF